MSEGSTSDRMLETFGTVGDMAEVKLKSDYADLLNKLVRLQSSFFYRAIRAELQQAERLIVALEARAKKAEEQVAGYQLVCAADKPHEA